MLFGYTILYVEDVPNSVAFYEKAFGFKRRFLHEGCDYGELDTGGTVLAFASRKLIAELGKNPSTPVENSPCFEIAFVTEDVSAALAQAVTAGATQVQAPEEMPWGQTIAYVRDIDGFLVELCTPVAA
ncbi:MAG TPA: VOC family protein [Cellvibrionaceae bacterium]